MKQYICTSIYRQRQEVYGGAAFRSGRRRSAVHASDSLTCASGRRGLLAAAADSLGRVLLIDCPTATVLRVFKGYRHAAVRVGGAGGCRPAAACAALADLAQHGAQARARSTTAEISTGTLEKERLYKQLDLLGKLTAAELRGDRGETH